MDMHAGAGELQERLGHEAGAQAVPAGDAVDQAAQQDRVVRRRHRVGAVIEVHLILAGRGLRDHGVGRQALDARRLADLVQQARIGVEVGHGIHVLPRRAAALAANTGSGTPSGPGACFIR